MKKFCSILKNYKKFDDIRLSNAISIYEDKYTYREGYDGTSTNLFGTKWFITPKGKALFKHFEPNYSLIDKTVIRAFNEVLIYNIAKSAMLNCAIYQPAVINYQGDNLSGVVSYNFLKKDEKILTFTEFLQQNDIIPDVADFKNILIALGSDKYVDYSFNIEEIKRELYELIVLDTLTFQADRNFSNLAFIVNKKQKTIKLAPIHDNEYAFLMGATPFEYIDFQDVKDIKNYINFYDGRFIARVLLFDSSTEIHETEIFSNQVEYIARLANRDKNLNKSLKRILNVDINKVYDNLEKEGYEINDYYKQYTTMLFNYAKKQIKSKYLEISKDDLQL